MSTIDDGNNDGQGQGQKPKRIRPYNSRVTHREPTVRHGEPPMMEQRAELPTKLPDTEPDNVRPAIPVSSDRRCPHCGTVQLGRFLYSKRADVDKSVVREYRSCRRCLKKFITLCRA